MNNPRLSVETFANQLEGDLRMLVSPALEPLFWTPELLGKPSAWWAHLPFAFWIMSIARPRLFVELGSHYGVSYSGFCEAAARARTGSRCYAVDTWEGDKHAGYFDEAVYHELKEFHDRRYSAFSELLKCKFDDALPHFADGSIDLLHIDGFHSYESVSHDFEGWLPKISDRGVVSPPRLGFDPSATRTDALRESVPFRYERLKQLIRPFTTVARQCRKDWLFVRKEALVSSSDGAASARDPTAPIGTDRSGARPGEARITRTSRTKGRVGS